MLIVAGAFDVLDGAVARLSGGVSPFGGYLDSMVDRYSDFCILFGILVQIDRHWHGPQRLLYLILWGLVVVGTSTTAYARARAETVIPRCKVGFMERPERTVTVILGLLCANVHLSLWILAVMTNLISVQRILYSRLADGRKGATRSVLVLDVSACDRPALRHVRSLHSDADLRASSGSAAVIVR